MSWLEVKFVRSVPQKIVTLNVMIDKEASGSLAVSCTTIDGSEVLYQNGMDITVSSVRDVRQKLAGKLVFEDLRLLPDGWFYSEPEVQAWAPSCGGGLLKPRPRAVRMYGHILDQEGSAYFVDQTLLDSLDESEVHWQTVWAAAPKLRERVVLCTLDGQLLTRDDDGTLLSSLALRSAAQLRSCEAVGPDNHAGVNAAGTEA